MGTANQRALTAVTEIAAQLEPRPLVAIHRGLIVGLWPIDRDALRIGPGRSGLGCGWRPTPYAGRSPRFPVSPSDGRGLRDRDIGPIRRPTGLPAVPLDVGDPVRPAATAPSLLPISVSADCYCSWTIPSNCWISPIDRCPRSAATTSVEVPSSSRRCGPTSTTGRTGPPRRRTAPASEHREPAAAADRGPHIPRPRRSDGGGADHGCAHPARRRPGR